MQQSSFRFFQDLFNSIGNRVKLGHSAPSAGVPDGFARLLSSCHLLLSDIGEASKIATAEQALFEYGQLSKSQKEVFFHHLDTDFGVDPSEVRSAYRQWDESSTGKALNDLFLAVEPQRQDLLRQLNLAPGATPELMKMRADLLVAIQTNPSLKAIDADFVHLFRSWFNRGFLVLKRIDWNTPASILEKIVQYEAVHRITGWDDLRRRLDAKDRRCYGFFHPATGDEPLIFVEVALCQGVAVAVAPLLAASDQDNTGVFDTAIFYSISNCQKGLRGISFGNFLIKQVVVELSQELPQLKKFATLSPVPGFAEWLAKQAKDDGQVLSLVTLLQTQTWCDNEALQDRLRPQLLNLAATYIVTAKSSNKQVSDPVAKFHLGNGASVDGIHWPADLSEKGLAGSWGVMINYWYELEQIEARHEAFVQNHSVSYGLEVEKLLIKKVQFIEGID